VRIREVLGMKNEREKNIELIFGGILLRVGGELSDQIRKKSK